MNQIPEQIMLNLYTTSEQMSLVSPRMLMEQTPQVIRYESDLAHPLYNRVLAYQGELSEEGNSGIKAMIDYYQEKKLPFSWLIWSHDYRSSDVKSVLEANGLKKVGEITGMSLSLKGWKYDLPDIPGFEIKPVRTMEEMEGFKQIVPAVFELQGEAADVFVEVNGAAAFSGKALFQHYVGFLNGEPASVVTAVTDGERIGIYNVATLDTYRRKGLGSAITAHALLEAQAAGRKLAVLQASKMGEGVYEALGFSNDVTIEVYLG